jgi:hypothetical protein
LLGYRQHVSRPCVERAALLCRPIVPLVYASDAAAAAAGVIEHRIAFLIALSVFGAST